MGQMNECNICHCDFDLELEGGAEGYFGIIPVSFCPTCFACMYDMFSYQDDPEE